MFSLKRMLGRREPLFDLLEAGSTEARQSVRAIVELINNPRNLHALEQSIASRKQEKQIHEQITNRVCSTFVTPMEREDIEALANALSRITKVAKKFSQRMLLFSSQVHADLFTKQADILEQAANTLCEMVHDLRHGVRLQKIQGQNKCLQKYEGDADNVMLDLMEQIYAGQYAPLQMIIIRDLLEMLEKVIDRHRDAGNVILQIALKNS